MLKKLALFASLVLAPTVASAFTIGPNSITGNLFPSGTVTYYDNGAEAVSLKDLTDLSSAATIILESAGYADKNIFGIYGFTRDASGNITVGNHLEVFLGTQSTGNFPDTTLKWQFDADTQTWTVENMLTHATSNIGTTFGFYLDSNGDSTKRYYSQHVLNPNGVDLFKIYDVSDHASGNASDVVVAIEDTLTGDRDFNDMVVGVNDVTPVPEPGTMMLLGAGFLGLAIYGKRRKNA